MIGIVIATFQRPDGKTPSYLERTLSSVDAQTFRDYRVYVIGDAYENEPELREVVRRHPQTVCFNLDRSPERERYGFGNINIWHAAGITAANKGIELALADGLEYVCHLSHDDVWESTHLKLINKVIQEKQPLFICTLSTYVNQRILPNMPQTNEVIPFYPEECGMIASTACIKYTYTKLRIEDCLLTQGLQYPSDAYLWRQLKNEMQSTGKQGYLICTVTCKHDEEGYASGGMIGKNK
jgi:glycosyltransferase involved in cell wall biosynthesis